MSEHSLFNDQTVKRLTQKNTLVETIYQIIADGIKSENLKPGQRLRQEEVAQSLNVSPRTVREAFKKLLGDGLLVSEPYKGVRVASMTLKDQIELYEMRLLLEPRVVEKAAGKLSNSELDRLREIMPEAAIGKVNIPIAQIRERNREFHLIPIRASGMDQYIPILERLWELITTFFSQKEEHWQDYKESGEEDHQPHALILDALENGDGLLARKILEAHIQQYLDDLYKMSSTGMK